MRKWSRRKVEEDDEDISEAEMARRRRKYFAQKRAEEEEDDDEEEDVWFRRRRSFSDLVETLNNDYEEQEQIDETQWCDLEQKIRAGKYKPKHSDHYTLHVLYNNLKQRKLI